MITFIASFPHLYTFQALRGEVLGPSMPRTDTVTYDAFFARDSLQAGTYVFTDFERLHPAEVRLATHMARFYQGRAGFRFLNDPPKVRTRYGLLRALRKHGINDFDAYCAESYPRPERFPVFLRIASDHAGPIGDLIQSQSELDRRLSELEDGGVSLTGVLVIEFCAEPRSDGLYEKLAVYRIGDRLTLAGLLVGEAWNVKEPDMDLVDARIMQDHLDAMREDRFAEGLRAAFDLAGIEYGRADLGFGNGRLQVYEINTNPMIKAGTSFISDEHRESREVFRRRFAELMHAIDLPPGPAVPMDLGALDFPSEHRRQLAVHRMSPPKPFRRLLRNLKARPRQS